MKIEFEFKNKEHIVILGVEDNGKRSEIGRIFTPSGSAETTLNAIQVCGFDEAFNLWGCGMYGDAETKQMKKDIQLCWFKSYKLMSQEERRNIVIGTKEHPCSLNSQRLADVGRTWKEEIKVDRVGGVIDGKVCGKCFNHPCSCEIKTRYENPYTVKRKQDLQLNLKKVKYKKE